MQKLRKKNRTFIKIKCSVFNLGFTVTQRPAALLQALTQTSLRILPITSEKLKLEKCFIDLICLQQLKYGICLSKFQTSHNKHAFLLLEPTIFLWSARTSNPPVL